MATNLCILTNSKFIGIDNEVRLNEIINEIEKLNIEKYRYVGFDEQIYDAEGNWQFEINNGCDDENSISIEFDGATPFTISLYSNVCLIYTIYKFSLIYENYSLEMFSEFRNELFELIKIFGGTEAIYLSDFGGSLAYYTQTFVWENMPYKEIKAKLIEDLGEPITDFKVLDFTFDSYEDVNEFFVDTFDDLKS